MGPEVCALTPRRVHPIGTLEWEVDVIGAAAVQAHVALAVGALTCKERQGGHSNAHLWGTIA